MVRFYDIDGNIGNINIRKGYSDKTEINIEKAPKNVAVVPEDLCRKIIRCKFVHPKKPSFATFRDREHYYHSPDRTYYRCVRIFNVYKVECEYIKMRRDEQNRKNLECGKCCYLCEKIDKCQIILPDCKDADSRIFKTILIKKMANKSKDKLFHLLLNEVPDWS